MKSDSFFLFENANWPTLLVEESGVIRRSNHAAVQLFGPVVESESSPLNSIWSPENKLSAEKFLAHPERAVSGAIPLKFRVKTTAAVHFTAYICPCTREDRKYFFFQLFPEVEQTLPTPIASAAPLDAGLVHKQKLDCALQLARTVALDFNNALTSVLGHASLLLSKADADHAWRGSLVEIEKSAAKAAEIAADLAAFSRQEKDNKAQVHGNLNSVLLRTVELFRGSETDHVSWSLQLERKLFAASFDEAKLQQAFVKILENAVEAVGSHGQITVESRNLELSEPTQDRTVKVPAGTYICVEIADTGPGIAADVLPRIFEPFFTTKEKPHRGLGLAFAYGIVTNHSGNIAVSSNIGLGTSVRIYVPAKKKFIRETNVDTNDLFGVETILMVDDEDLLLNMGQMVLSSFGYQVLTANSGQKALEILGAGEHVDLIITDLVMPQMSGRELMDRLRENWPAIRVLCTSGYVRSQNNNEESAGYLQKPFTSQELLRKVKEALG